MNPITGHPGPVRVVVFTASVGGGHDGPARELARMLTARGACVDVIDLIDLAPLGTGQFMRWLYRRLLTVAPGWWGRLFAGLDRPGRSVPLPMRMLIEAIVPGIIAVLAGGDVGAVDVAVSTFPLGGHALAAARRRGGPAIPSVTYVTDPAVHRLWAAPGTDLYLTSWRQAVGALSAVVADEGSSAPVVAVAPLVRPEFRRPANRQRDRGIPAEAGRLVLLASGSWAVGAVRRTAVDILAAGLTPVVVCGRNDRLRRQVARLAGAIALTWVDDMAALMHACHVGVLNSGGLTLAEAAVSGLPVVHHRPLPGQGRANARFCTEAGWGPSTTTPAELRAALTAAPPASRPPLPSLDAAAVVLHMAVPLVLLPQAG